MKKFLAIAITAGIGFVSGCTQESPSPSTPKPSMTTSPETKSNVPTGTTPMTMPTTKPMAMTPTAVPPANVGNVPAGTPPEVTTSWDPMHDGMPIFFKLRGEGVQIYEPVEKDGKMMWSLKAPEALLYDDKGRNVGKLYGSDAGPVWEMSDGSKVVVEMKAKAEKPGTIPWMSATVKLHEGNQKGKLATVGSLQRIDTDGGLEPKMMPMKEMMGKDERVPYRAT